MLAELNREEVVAYIAGMLHGMAQLYQVPNFGPTQSVHLAGWMLRNYKYEQLGTVQKALENYRSVEDKTFRMTPDIITDAMTQELEREAEKRETDWMNLKHQNPEGGVEISEKTQKLVDKFLNRLKRHEDIPYISDPMKTWRLSVVKRFAKEYDMTIVEMNARYDKWYKSGTLLSFEEWLLKPEE